MVLRYLLAMLAWATAGFVALWFASATKAGPVVVFLTPAHGVHEGDVVVLAACAFFASVVSLAALRRPAG